MSIKTTASRYASPKRAVRHYTGDLSRRPAGNEIPAMLWLWLAIVAIIQVRRGGLSNGLGGISINLPEVVAIGVGAGLVVLVGSVAPRIVLLILAALLVAGALGAVAPVAGALATFEAWFGNLLNGPAGGGGSSARAA